MAAIVKVQNVLITADSNMLSQIQIFDIKILMMLKGFEEKSKNAVLKYLIVRFKKCGTLHDFACHPCAGAMLIFSVSFQF